MKKHFAILLFLSLAASARAEVKPNALFSDNAVLQQETSIPVWGTAAEGESVTVSLNGQKVSTTAKGGKWKVEIPAQKAGGPHTLVVSGATNTVTATNVLVGEVWVCSGQSNMEFRLGGSGWEGDSQAALEIPKAEYPNLRMFSVPKRVGVNPAETLDGQWVVCSPATVGSFSAVGYYFGREVLKARSVPVGMINSSWGGTRAEAWTSFQGLANSPALKVYTDALLNAVAGYCKSLETFRQALETYHSKNPVIPTTPPWPTDLPTNPPTNPFAGPHIPTGLYNGMIAPLVPYAIRGVIWYQGESNADKSALYQSLFPGMIADWREKWGRGEFPFLFTQIAPYGGQPPEIREAQFLTLRKSPNTAMAVTTDVGDARDIHPRKKQPVGQRLALAARALAYGERIEYSGPLFESFKIDGNKVVVTFSHVGSGLIAQGGDLKGFTISGSDAKFVPAKAEIVGETVVVSSPQVASPTAVRYGWANVPDVNLFNKEGLPASPFRSDVPALH